MTEIEAIEVLKQPCYCDYDLSATIEDCDISSCDKRDAFKLAINALEKQIPKKITHPGCYDNEGIWHTWNGINGVPYDLCPNCKINLCTGGVFGRDKNKMKYCKNCGQKLDWSDEK